MTTPEQVDAWIEQAQFDLTAARDPSDVVRHCHRRYWLQQAYEKAIKAYALMRWAGTPAEKDEFERQFLLQHSPLKRLSAVATPLSKALHLLRREALAFVSGLDNAAILLQIDATTPRNDPAEVSYRYPFLHEGAYVAPASYDRWDIYQGNLMGACAAVDRLIAAVKEERRAFARR